MIGLLDESIDVIGRGMRHSNPRASYCTSYCHSGGYWCASTPWGKIRTWGYGHRWNCRPLIGGRTACQNSKPTTCIFTQRVAVFWSSLLTRLGLHPSSGENYLFTSRFRKLCAVHCIVHVPVQCRPWPTSSENLPQHDILLCNLHVKNIVFVLRKVLLFTIGFLGWMVPIHIYLLALVATFPCASNAGLLELYVTLWYLRG